MKTKDVKVRGCCMGIPFGCGSLFLLALTVGGMLGYVPLSGTLLLTAVGRAVAGVALFAGGLIVSEWLRESLSVRLRPRSPFAPSSR